MKSYKTYKTDDEDSLNEAKNDYIGSYGKNNMTISIKNGLKLGTEDEMYKLYKALGKVIENSGLNFKELTIK